MTPKENTNYGTRNERAGRANGIPIRCIETGEVYESVSAASRAVNISRSCITQAAIAHKPTKGLHWEYVVAASCEL